ncbi:MAG: NADH:flavin oxidoreductase [Gammaproteobacteria bacterium]|nr:NADH:flavin oxidoreductase [Gammaproteobacteria bacterium]MDH3535747.1 NADH:flavin oxidoreductase [Gammaproteobacteria bacterium]
MTGNDPLLQPFQLKHLTLKNRLMTSAHEPAYTDDGMPKERYRLYHATRAKAGLAMTMTAGSALVSKDSPPAFGNILAYREDVVPWMRALVDSCHEHDCKVMIQLTHLGRRAHWNHSDWLPTVSPSGAREPAHRAFPKIIEDWDIERIVADYALAAEHMQAAGLDGIELQCYGHLIDQFWSPVTNFRDDEWGGALDNRLRFTHLILDAIRARVSVDFIVGLRLVVDEQMENGITREVGIEIARRMVATGQIDFLNVIRGHIDTDAALTDVIPVQGMPSAPHLDFAGEVRRETKFPVFHAARIADIATARHAVASGKLDMVGMARAHIADPLIVQKLVEGREQDIRPCVGATYCLDRIYLAGEALCIHNPATGREATMPHQIDSRSDNPQKIVVVGAGPAGLEAARVAAERGHQVIVFEATPEPGGQVRLMTQSPRRREMIGIVDWRVEQCDKAGVEFRFNTYAEAEDVIAENPDIVIIASGGLPHTELLKSGNELVVSARDIISGDVVPAADVLLYDDGADHPGMQAAEIIAQSGAKLEYVSPERQIAPDIGGTNLTPYMRKLLPLDVRFTLCRRALHATREGGRIRVTLGSDYGDFASERTVDQVVVEHGTLPLDEVYFALKPLSRNLGEVDYDALIDGRPQAVERNSVGKFKLFRIGDAVASRNIHAAVYDALRLVKDL